MMYDELIKNLRGMAKGFCAFDRSNAMCGYFVTKQAADAIEELQKCIDGLEADNDNLCERIKDLPKWIPVTERLPEENEVVLVADKANDIGIGSLQPLWHGVVWVVPFEDVDNEFCPISHWMPLPEPPGEKES